MVTQMNLIQEFQSQEAQVKQLLKEAYDAQDVDKIAEAIQLLLKSILKKKDLESSSNKESKNKQLKKMHDRAKKRRSKTTINRG